MKGEVKVSLALNFCRHLLVNFLPKNLNRKMGEGRKILQEIDPKTVHRRFVPDFQGKI